MKPTIQESVCELTDWDMRKLEEVAHFREEVESKDVTHKNVPLLKPYEIADFLKGRLTNFPEYFKFQGGVLMTTRPHAEIIPLIPYAYFSVQRGLKTLNFQALSRPMDIPASAGFCLATAAYRPTFVPRPKVEPPLCQMKVERGPHGLVFTQGAGLDAKVFEVEGRRFEVGVGTGDSPIEVSQELVRRVEASLSIPAWREHRFEDPNTYHSKDYEEVEKSHGPMMDRILERIPPGTYVIAPGDGKGLVASRWEGEGVFGDKIVTASSHPRVVQETAEETIARARPRGAPVVVICSYISVFYSGDTGGYPSLWIDYPLVMDRVPGLIPVSQALYHRDYPIMMDVLFDRPGRGAWTPYRLPYPLEALKHDEFRVEQITSAAIQIVRHKTITIATDRKFHEYFRRLGANVEDVSDQDYPLLATTLKQMEGRGRAYFVPAGRVLSMDEAIVWTGRERKMSTRTLYWVFDYDRHLVPGDVYREEIGGLIYFIVLDEQTRSAIIRYQVGADFNQRIVPVEIYQDLKTPDTLEAVLERIEVGMTLFQVKEMCEDAGLTLSRAYLHQIFKKHAAKHIQYEEEDW